MAITHRACAPGAHIGEVLARNYLMQELTGSRGILLTNYHHPVHNATDEHDLVLINECGVWALEVKHWYGRIDADAIHWLHNGINHPSPISTIEMKAKRLASTVQRAGFRNVSVVGMVVLTRHEARFRATPPPEHHRKIFRLTRPLIDAVTGTDYLFRSNNVALTPTMIQNIANAFASNHVDPQRQIIGNYRLVRDLESHDGFDSGEALHTTIERRARVKRYQATGYTSEQELKNAVRRFARDVTALEGLAGHPNIVRVYDFMPDRNTDDTYWLMLEWVEGENLRDRLDDDTPIPLDEQIRILRSLTTALEACHKKGIIHRNVSPSSIYLDDDGSIKLGDFDLSRVPGVGKTISTTGRPPTTSKYLPPEVRDSHRSLNEQSDFYSVGAIWYDMLLRRPPDEPVVLRFLNDDSIPKDVQEILRILLAPQQHKRPTDGQEVLAWLDMV